MREVRAGGPEDIPALIEIFWRGVHEGAAPKYSPEARQAWLPERPNPKGYAERIRGQSVFVAERAGVPVGYMTLTADGLIDFAYVLPEERGQGTADALLAMVENQARVAGLLRLTTKASDMARPFFQRLGWQVTGDASVIRDGVRMSSTAMARDLTLTPLAAAS